MKKENICDESAPKLSIPSLQMLSSSIFAFTSSFEGAYLGWQLWSGKIHRAENAILMHHNNSIELFLFNIHLICLLSLFNSLIMDRARTPWIVKGNKSLSLVWSKWGSQAANIRSSFMCCNLPLVKWLLGQWGILKHIPQSRCIFISHWSREK